eukprot:1621037-Rhodomonas_salina.1
MVQRAVWVDFRADFGRICVRQRDMACEIDVTVRSAAWVDLRADFMRSAAWVDLRADFGQTSVARRVGST